MAVFSRMASKEGEWNSQMSSGDPTSVTSGIVHLRSKALLQASQHPAPLTNLLNDEGTLLSTILKIF